MKRISVFLFFAFLLPSFKAMASVNFQSALQLYKDKQYEKAYEAFLILADSDYTNVDYNYYLARSAFFVKEYNEAISAYERILIQYPNNARSKLELGRLYYEMHRYTEARKYLNEVLKTDAPQAVKNNIRYYLAGMDQDGERLALNTVRATLLGSVFYDSNLNYSPESDEMILPSGSLKSAADIGAWGSEQMLVLNHRYENPNKQSYAWLNDFVLYNKASPGNSDYNILYGSYSPALSFQQDRWTLDAGLTIDGMNYGKDPYMVSYGISPKATYMPNLTEYFTTQFRFLKRDYQTNSTKPKDSKFAQISTLYQKRVGPLFSWYGQAVLERETADAAPTKLLNVDYHQLGLKAGVAYLFPRNFTLSSTFGYQDKLFENADRLTKNFGGGDVNQHDKRYYGEVTLSKDFARSVTTQLRASRIQNDSNLSVYAYQKNLYTFNVMKRF
ncbi:tetratricopeptide repeat protein [Hydrogenovibrio sp. JE_KL2]|uniref:tetratricopeptide repeat protein n=1 Tax=Hydrogenovibrio sp. JE_KL2 TaxID=2651188 RepID=UPI00128C4EA2|nr:tetratricopeptide repeat protein [Hydrogenovibrio sp. JE_KL2]MPQ77236.1 tetratricopeptide repeat protein [Hydrogenovibrio sp. JE_KL2]